CESTHHGVCGAKRTPSASRNAMGVAGNYHSLCSGTHPAARAAKVHPVEGGIQEMREEARVGAAVPDVQRLGEDVAEGGAGVSGAYVSVPLVGEADGVPHGGENGEALVVRQVENQPAAGPQAACEFPGESGVVFQVFHEVHNDDEIERLVRPWKVGTRKQFHPLTNHAPDCAGGALGKIGAAPAAAGFTKKVADYAVVGPQVQGIPGLNIRSCRLQLTPLGLLEHGRAKERELALTELKIGLVCGLRHAGKLSPWPISRAAILHATAAHSRPDILEAH